MKVVLGGLKDRAEELQSFLEPRVGVKPSVSAGEMRRNRVMDQGGNAGLF